MLILIFGGEVETQEPNLQLESMRAYHLTERSVDMDRRKDCHSRVELEAPDAAPRLLRSRAHFWPLRNGADSEGRLTQKGLVLAPLH